MNIDIPITHLLSQKTGEVWTIAPDTMVIDALRMMAEKNVGALPVVESDQLIGLISERDYSRKIVLKGRTSRETSVRDIMTPDVVTAAPGDLVADCMRRMSQHRIRHLPVLEEGKLTGIVSMGDMVNYTINAQEAALDQLEKYITGEYPA